MLTVFIDPVFESHITGRHPESPARIEAIRQRLTNDRILQLGRRGIVGPAEDEQLLRVHSAAHLERLGRMARAGGGQLDPDTIMSAASEKVARLAAGAATAAVDDVLSGRSQRALALVRPPGHHALSDRAMGFCLFNNVAVAAAQARSVYGLERLLIVDWDVHHGNGTQDVFYHDGQTTFFSVHRFPFYPGTGAAEETGSGDGLGATFNLPLPYGTSPAAFHLAFAAMLDSAARRSRPQLVLISAGFDAHREDPIGDLGLEADDFRILTKAVTQVADTHCQGKVVSVLEGGYHVERLAECVDLHAAALAEK